MYRVALVILISLICRLMYAQSFQLIDAKNDISGAIDSKIDAPLRIQNTGTEPINIQLKINDIQLSSGQNAALLLNDKELELNKDNFALSINLLPGETSHKIISQLNAGLAPTSSSVTFCIFDTNNPSDSILHEVRYTVEERKAQVLFNNSKLQISSIFPNPADEQATFQYKLYDTQAKAKLVIHNVLGSIVGEYELNAYESSLTIPTGGLMPGIYFYTLHLEEENQVTKKFVVKR